VKLSYSPSFRVMRIAICLSAAILFASDGRISSGYNMRINKAKGPCDLTQRGCYAHRGQPLYSSKISSDVVENVPKSSGIPPWVAPFGTAAMGGFLFGSDIGCSSSVVRILGAKTAEFGSLTALELGQIASSSLFGAMIASGLLVYFGDAKIGRKLEFQLASVLFLIGTLIQSLSPTLSLIYLGE
jgi:Sugar (and other) transporter